MQDNFGNGASEQDVRAQAPETEEQPEHDKNLDENLCDTFPASDPVTGPSKAQPAGVPTQEEIDRARRADKIKKD